MSKYKPEELNKSLRSDEIELKVNTVKKNSGFSILLYKTARVDRNRLDNAFGVLGWRNNYKFDKKDNLVAIIEVWDDDKQQWIPKSDIGVESNYEKEKGMYSDAFKRAGFRWGIGIELYNAPFIWINWKKWKNNGKPKVYLDNWDIELKDEEKGIKSGFSIIDGNGKVQWTNVKNKKDIKDKQQLISDKQQQIKEQLKYLKNNEINNFQVLKRMNNSVKKNLGTKKISTCKDLDKLNKYLNKLKNKE